MYKKGCTNVCWCNIFLIIKLKKLTVNGRYAIIEWMLTKLIFLRREIKWKKLQQEND